MVGARIRGARQARHLSLNTVAQKAEISVATLSRIERDQQRIDVGLLMTLSRILKIAAQDMLDEVPPEEAEGLEPMVAKISAMPSLERTKLWNGLAANRTQGRQSGSTRALAQQVEEFLAQIDFLRGEIEAVRKKLR